MHGGSVIAASAGAGAGTTFEIRLPRIEQVAEPGVHPAQGKAPPRRVLIVDDNIDAADSLSMILKLDGHEARAVYTPHDALEQVAAFSPDLVLLDIGLPDIDGYEVARRIRKLEEGRQLRLVALTGYGQTDDRQRARAAGFDGHLVKPVDFPMLERILSETESN